MDKINFGISEKTWSLLLDTLAGYEEIDQAVIFGSRAKGNCQKGSDIDIAIYGDRVDAKIALDLSASLNEKIASPYHFDVLAGNSVTNPDLIDHIERVGQPFYKRSNGIHT